MCPRPTYLKRALKQDGSEWMRRKYDCAHYNDCLLDGPDCCTFVCDNCDGDRDD